MTGMQSLQLQHFYRAMAWIGEELDDQKGATPFSPRCTKDLIEEKLFLHRRDLFNSLDLVFFDTTTIYFEGNGGQTIGKRGNNKDHRPDFPEGIPLEEADGCWSDNRQLWSTYMLPARCRRVRCGLAIQQM